MSKSVTEIIGSLVARERSELWRELERARPDTKGMFSRESLNQDLMELETAWAQVRVAFPESRSE